MIAKYCKKLKYRRKIVLMTNGRGQLDADGIAEIMKKIKEDDMELVVVYDVLANWVQRSTDKAVGEWISMIPSMDSKKRLRTLGRSASI